MPAVALTDRGNLFGLVKFYKACRDAGVKPIAGVELDYEDGDGGVCRCRLLVASKTGYDNLLSLVSAAYTASPADASCAGLGARHSGGARSRCTPGGARRRRRVDRAARGGERCGRCDRRRRRFVCRAASRRLAAGIRRSGLSRGCPHGTGRRGSVRCRRRRIGGGCGSARCGLQRRSVPGAGRFRGPRKRVSASRKAVFSTIRDENATTASSSICARRTRCASCSETSRRRWRTPCNSPNDAAWSLSSVSHVCPSRRSARARTSESMLRARAREGLEGHLRELAGSVDEAVRRRYEDRLDYELGIITEMGFRGLLPDRRRVRDLGACQYRTGGMPGVPAPPHWSLSASASRNLIRLSTTSCSSVC